jgi:hypothetical protein
MLDARTLFHYAATGVTPAMAVAKRSGDQDNPLATFRREISDFWIVADEVRKARPAALAAGVI